MKALSIRQPWAHFILNLGKDIENRNWSTNVRGRCLIHAGQTMSVYDSADAWAFAEGILHRKLPGPHWEVWRGGIVGSVEIVDCVTASDSPWFAGVYGFVLRNPIPLAFVPFRGSLGFFDVPDSLVPEASGWEPGDRT